MVSRAYLLYDGRRTPALTPGPAGKVGGPSRTVNRRRAPGPGSAGLIHELGEFVLREAAHQTARWVRDDLLPPDVVTSVNLSAVQLSDRRISDAVLAAQRAAASTTSA